HAHYILSDTQQAEVESVFGHVDWRVAGALLVMLVLGAPLLWLASALTHNLKLGLLIGVVFYSLYLQVLLNAYWWLSLRRMLVDAPPTRERIGFTERYVALANNMPWNGLILAAIFCAALTAWGAHGIITANTFDVLSLAVAIFSGWSTVCLLGML